MLRTLTWLLAATILAALFVSCGPSRSTAAPELLPAGDERTPTEQRAIVLRAEDRREVDSALLATLNDPRPEIRAYGVRGVGRIGDRDYRDRLVEALSDEDGQVRAVAAFALGLIGDTQIDPALAALAQDADPRVRAALADALMLIGDPGSEPILLQLIDDEDPAVSTRACYASPAVAGVFAVERLIRETSSVYPERRLSAVYALARLSGEIGRLDHSLRQRVREVLMNLVGDSVGEIRRWVAAGLEIPVDDAQATVLGRLSKDREVAVRIEAVRSFTFPGAPIKPFLDKTLADSDDRVALATVVGFGQMRGDEVSETLATLVVDDSRPWLRTAAVLSMPGADPIRAAEMANGLTKSELFPLRRASSQLVLEPFGEKRIENVLRLWNDEERAIRDAVIPALGWASDSLPETLGELIEDENRLTRIAIARAAGRLLSDGGQARREEALELLERLWTLEARRGDARVQIHILNAAARGGASEAAMPLLERGLSTEDFGVRLTAARQLNRLFPDAPERFDAVPPTTALDPYVRIARWAERPWAAIFTVERPGFRPGRFTVALDVINAPMTCWNFAQLADAGAFDGLELEAIPNLLLRPGNGVSEGYGDRGPTLRSEPSPNPFAAGTLVAAAGQRDAGTGGWLITLSARPEWNGRRTPFGRVMRNFPGVVGQLLPQDRIVSIEVYTGDGTEPLPPLE